MEILQRRSHIFTFLCKTRPTSEVASSQTANTQIQKHKYTNTQTQKYKYTQGTFPFAWQGRPLGLHHHRLQTYIVCTVLQAVRVCGVCGIQNTHIIPQIRLAELKSCNSTRAPNQAYKRCNSIAIAILLQ